VREKDVDVDDGVVDEGVEEGVEEGVVFVVEGDWMTNISTESRQQENSRRASD